MREIVKIDNFAFDTIYKQLEEMDFTDFVCSPLINGGCGLGKTTALVSDEMYELFCRKLQKAKPQILVIESRAATRDQLQLQNTNSNYHFYQFQAASMLILSNYDLIIIDEAHSLFSDSEFAPQSTAPLAEWLKKSLCFQIYITASDEEFISFANRYFNKKEFKLTFPNTNEVHCRYTAKSMYLSINAEKVDKIIKRKTSHFFERGKRGLFFILSVKDVVSLYNYFCDLRYKCGFYVSQQNETQIIKREEKNNEDPEDFDEYSSRTITMDVLDFYKTLEKQRKECGKETIREALLKGRFPDDIDYLFMTSTGQEGLSLYDMHLDFIFVEDTFPLTINQKIFRYRGNVEEVYIHLPQRRIEQALLHTMKKIEELKNASQEYLKGYYEGAGGKGFAKCIWYDENDGLYKVAENYITYLLVKNAKYLEIKENRNNAEGLKEIFGQFADNFYLLNSVEDRRKDILVFFFKDKMNVLVTAGLKKKWLQELKDLGLSRENYKKDFTFTSIINWCKEYEICNFKEKQSANKKDCKLNPEIQYRKKYTRIIPY